MDADAVAADATVADSDLTAELTPSVKSELESEPESVEVLLLPDHLSAIFKFTQ